MKRLLIISPYFPPFNTPDLQRVRMSLPYFEQYGWEAEVVTVAPEYADMPKDELLLQTIPPAIKVHTVKAFNKQWTSKLGFGNIALRSYPFYRKAVNKLLKAEKYDLIYFSTTQFAICVLGPYWKKRFNVPYVIDMQDPWHSTYYQDKPKHQQPPKYWFSYRLNKYLEPLAMTFVDGLISVSEAYIINLKNRYPAIKNIPESVITFCSFKPDMEIALKHTGQFANLLEPGFKNMVYAGRGGLDMYNAITPVFKALQQGLNNGNELYSQIRLYFIGTSYAPPGTGIPTIVPLARQFGVEKNVVEITGRITYFHTLNTLQQADALFIAGSDDPAYTASKIYPYLLAQKPLLAIFNPNSPALSILKDCGVDNAYSYTDKELENHITAFFDSLKINNVVKPVYNETCLEQYDAQNMTKKQCQLFDQVLNITVNCK